MKIWSIMVALILAASAAQHTAQDPDDSTQTADETVPVQITETAESTPEPEAEEVSYTDRVMTGEILAGCVLNRYSAEAYDGDVTTDHIFSAQWDLTAPEEERLGSFTGKPQMYDITLSGDTLDLTMRTAPWDMETTDYAMRTLWEASVNQTIMEPWISVGERNTEHAANEYMTASAVTENGDIIPLSVVWVFQRQGNGSYGYTFSFDRAVTEEAVSFIVDFHLPEEDSVEK